MRTEILNQEKNKINIKVEVDAEQFKNQIDKAVREMANNVEVKGFRKGKIPRNVLELKFGLEAIYTEALDSLLPEIMNEIINDYELDIISKPKMDIKTMEEGKDLELEFEFETMPEVTLPELGSIETRKLKVNVTEEMINEAVSHVQKEHGDHVDITDRTTTEADDVLDISYSTRILEDESESEETSEQSEPSDTLLDLKQEGLDEKIRQALINKETGDNVDVDITIESYPQDKSLEGKIARHSIAIKGIKKHEPAELTPEFFKKVTGREMESESEFHDFVKEQLELRMDHDASTAAQNEALTKVVENSEIEAIPESMVQTQIDELKKNDEETIKKQLNKSLKDYLEESGMSEDEYEKTVRERAEQGVKNFLVLDALSAQEGITVTDSDIDNEIKAIADQYGMDFNAVKSVFLKEEDKVREMRTEIKHKKIMSALMEKVQVTEVDSLQDGSEDNKETDESEPDEAKDN
jgi:trigger factor